MGNLLGSGVGTTVPTQAVEAQGMQVQGSQYGLGLAIVYGRARIAGNLIWYGDFQAVKNVQSTGKGGGGQSVSYTYSSSFQLALCEGPITGIEQIWLNSGLVTLSDINGTFSPGTLGQAAWSHLSSPANLQYPYTAWVGCTNIKLGSSPNVPNFNFLINGLLQFAPAGSPAIYDADPSAIFSDLLTSSTHGLGFQFLGDLTLYHDYCLANSIFLSPVVNQETTMQEVLTRMLQITNSNTAWSNGKLIVIPYGDEAATGNGATYTPPTTVVAALTDDDFIKPVRIDRKPLSDLYNVVRVQWTDPNNNYVSSVAEAKDQADIDQTFAIRQRETIQGDSITNGTLAQWVAQTLLQRALYIRNTYTFTTTMEYVVLEPGDVITLTDSESELTAEPVRIKSISEQAGGELQIVCEEFPAGVAQGAMQAIEPAAGFVPDVTGAPDTTQPPVIFRAPQFLVDGAVEIWIGVGGSGPNWGGANVLASFDDVNYTKIGVVRPGCRYGTLTAALADSSADPDTVNSFSVALDAGGTLSGGSDADADNLATLTLVDQELVAYSSATLNGDGTYTLGNGYLRRQCYETAHAAHAIGAPWMRVDDNIVRWQVDPSWVGKTVYLKFQAWNLYGGGEESLASLSAVTYVVGAAEEIPDTPPTPQNFTAVGAANGALITWENTNPAAVAITSVEYSPDGSTWTVLGQVQGTHYTHAFFGNATHYYRARARSGSYIWSSYTSSAEVGGGSIDYVASESVGTFVQLVLSVRNVAGPVVTGGALTQYTELRGATAWPSNVEYDVYSAGGLVDVFVATTSAPNGYIFRFDGRSGFARGQILIVTSGTWAPIGTQQNGTASSAAAGWHHVMFRYNPASGDHYIYVDGILECVANDLTYAVVSTNVYGGWEVSSSPIGPSTFYGGFLDSAQRVSTVEGAVSPAGSIVTGSSSVAFSYTSTTSSITISWAAGLVYRMDGTTTAVVAGSVSITGLNASATYYAAAYYDEVAGAISFVTGESGHVGTPQILYSSESAVVAWQAQLQARLNLGWIPVATPASGSGGGNGSSGCCVRGCQLVELASGVIRAAEALLVGDLLSAPTGYTRITQLRIETWREWCVIGFSDGRSVQVAPDHRFVDPSGAQVHARDLRLRQILQARDGYVAVTRMQALEVEDLKVGIEVEAPHTYYVDGVLSHNKVYC